MILVRVTLLIALCLLGLPASAQDAGTRIWNKLNNAHLIDNNYFPEVAEETAGFLAQAGGPWRGVQVNRPYRAGALNLYMVDATRIRDPAMLADEGVNNFAPESLAGGAQAHEDTGIVFINTATWKRIAAVAVTKLLKVQPNLPSAIAAIDVAGLPATERYWSVATLNSDTQAVRTAALLIRGAFAFALAHEMGHLRIGKNEAVEAEQRRLLKLTEREKDERFACPETLSAEFQQRQRQESAADLAAAQMLGQQCRIGEGGQIRHQIYVLGAGWYLTFAMADKVLLMGRNSTSPFIARMLQMQLGPQLYQQSIVELPAVQKRGGVRIAFPTTHPPDYSRWLAIDSTLQRSPCGGAGIDNSDAQLMEAFRAQMCKSLVGTR